MGFSKATHSKETAVKKSFKSGEARRLRAIVVSISFVPASQKVVGARWVNKFKTEDTFKRRLVVWGWSQVPGINYSSSTFIPVCRLQSSRMMLATAAELDYQKYTMDVQTTFLIADVEKEVFIKMPPRYKRSVKAGVPLVIHLKKRRYELRQSPKNWLGTMDQCLGDIRFRSFKSDPRV